MKIAHISDLHFAKPTWNPLQFLSKRWLGNFNLLLSRKKDFLHERLETLPQVFREQGVSHVVICGDVSTTSRKHEFAQAAKFVQSLTGMDVFTIPGNHDHYTRGAYRKKIFYDFFPASFSQLPFNMKEHGITVKALSADWWIVALDTALSTSWISSRGKFSVDLQERLEEVLSDIPSHHHVILINHFPFFQNDSPRKILIRGKELQQVIQGHPKIKFYLHGHSHRHCIADLRPNRLPIVCDSGSTPHRKLGSWNLLDITSQGCNIDVFTFNDGWKKERRVELAW